MKKTNAFTMIELVITMTIVVILSLISWPIYRSYHLKEVSMLGEGYALLGAIKDAQIHYYNEFGNFLHSADSYSPGTGGPETCTAIDPVLGINVMNNRYFSFFGYNSGYRSSSSYNNMKFEFIARVFGKVGTKNTDTVQMIMPYNLTKRGDLTIYGNGTTTIQTWNS